MPAAAPFQALRRGGATAGSGGKRGRGVADKLVGQPQCAADAREVDMPTSPLAESQQGLVTSVIIVSTQFVRAARVAP
jgi:hypothetical protein